MRVARLKTTAMSCSVNTHGETERARDPVDEPDRLQALLGGHARRRLVEEQQPRLERDRDGQLEPLLIAVSEGAGQVLRARVEPDQAEHLARPADLQGTGRAPRVPCGAAMGEESHLEVFEHGEVGEDAGDLKRAADARAGHRVRRLSGHVAALELDPPAVGADETGHGVEQRALAGTVGTDDGPELSRRHLQVHAVERADPTETAAEPDDAEYRFSPGQRGSPGSPVRRAEARPGTR